MRLLRRKKKGSHIVVDLVLLCGATGKHSRQLAACWLTGGQAA